MALDGHVIKGVLRAEWRDATRTVSKIRSAMDSISNLDKEITDEELERIANQLPEDTQEKFIQLIRVWND